MTPNTVAFDQERESSPGPPCYNGHGLDSPDAKVRHGGRERRDGQGGGRRGRRVRDDLLTHTVSLAALERLTVHLLALHLAGAEDPKRAAVLLKKSFGGEAPDAADAKAQELVEAACRAAGI